MATAASLCILVVVLGLLQWGRLPNALVTVPAAALVMVFELVGLDAALDTLDRLAPTLTFLAAILVIGEVARVAGLFGALGTFIERSAGNSPRRLLLAVAAAAVVVTAVMSLDATAVLFTPVVIHIVAKRGAPSSDAAVPLLTTAQLANASSGWFPVSNLTNLLVFSATGLTFAGFALRMALPTAVATAVVVGVMLLRTPRSVPAPSGAAVDAREVSPSVELDGLARLVIVTLVALVIAFFATSGQGIEPAWLTAGCAVFLALVALITRRDRIRSLVTAASPWFLVFVCALALVVQAAVDHGLGDAAQQAIPDGSGLAALLAIAVIAAVLANLVNNVPATLVLLAALSATHSATPARLLAVLIGVNIGPNLTYTGSLATILWRKLAAAAQTEPRQWSFYGAALLTTPPALVLATVALWCTLQVFG
ncbi:MAG: SLC13 family permease [Acidimicrobiia bacterium]